MIFQSHKLLSEVKFVAKKSRKRFVYVKDKKKLDSILRRFFKRRSSYFFDSTGILYKHPLFTVLFLTLSGKIIFEFLKRSLFEIPRESIKNFMSEWHGF